MKIISIVGVRPQFIKLAPLSKKMKSDIHHVVIHTGQHFDKNMSDIFFEDMDLKKPDYNLNISNGSHATQTGLMLIEIEKILIKENPNLVIIFGDTNTTLSGALATSKLGTPLLHIEAGLRSFNCSMPEEINRIIADHCSNYLFVPTAIAMDNIKKENLTKKSYFLGDIMIDSVNLFLESALSKSVILDELNWKGLEYCLLTLHRPYNVDNPDKLSVIFNFLDKLGYYFLFPIHPRTRKIIAEFNINYSNRIQLIDPVGYLDSLLLQYKSSKIFTDSGGIQKEAYILNKPCITIRTETEWVETVNTGWNKLVNPNINNLEDLVEEVKLFKPNKKDHINIFGDNVAEKMLNKIYNIINRIELKSKEFELHQV